MANKYCAIICCDFGTEGRKDILRHCFSFINAFKYYRQLWNVYHLLHNWKVWIEALEEFDV